MRVEVIAWACLSLALISAEVMAPGVFLLWLGIAAAVVFGVVLLVPGIPILWQALGFIVLSFASIAVYRKHFRQDAERNDQPLLNRRAEHFIGKNFVLESAIVNGSGRLKIGDAFWTVTGEDLPVGTRVRVVQSDGMVLTVVAD
ncbi:MAG: NfeD family protein [Gammaproteobacteria bacterium]|nr:NfeD family protein [Gammaproteobacteria bacterium]